MKKQEASVFGEKEISSGPLKVVWLWSFFDPNFGPLDFERKFEEMNPLEGGES